MAFILQLRELKNEVQRQLDDLQKDQKENSPDSRPANGLAHPDVESQAEKDDSRNPSDSNGNNGTEFSKSAYTRIPGIEARTKDDGTQQYIVNWSSPEDPNNPHNWTFLRRLKTTILLFMIAFVVTAASSIDSAVIMPAAEALKVSEVVEALGGTAIFLIGFGVGALLFSPLSEFLGRYPAYLLSLIAFGCFEVGAALSPNIGAQIAFRGLAGICASAPLTVAGGSMSDIWTPKEKTWAFPFFAISGFGGPILGPVMSAYIGKTGVLSWRWADWIALIFDGLVIFLVIALKEETLSPRLLKYKAHYFRKLTGDDRFKSEVEAKGDSIGVIVWRNFSRPFVLGLEPIVIAFSFYLTVIYIVLFTFLVGYPFIFEMVYGINDGLTFIIFVGLFVGVLTQVITVPFIYRHTLRQLKRDGDDGSGQKIDRESRLLFAMIGAPTVPAGLFWMGWTNFSHISIWSPIMASVLIGFGIISIFLSAYMYIIDSYEIYAASALTFVTLIRYLAAGGMTVVGVPMYENLGSHYTLTILACISAAVVPIPYLLYRFGPKIRSWSKYAVSPGT